MDILRKHMKNLYRRHVAVLILLLTILSSLAGIKALTDREDDGYSKLISKLDELTDKLNIPENAVLRVVKRSNVIGMEGYLIEWITPQMDVIVVFLNKDLRTVLHAYIHGKNYLIRRSSTCLVNKVVTIDEAFSKAKEFITKAVPRHYLKFLKLHYSDFIKEICSYVFIWLPEVNGVTVPQAEVSVVIDALNGQVISWKNKLYILGEVKISRTNITIDLNRAKDTALNYFLSKPRTVDARVTCHALGIYAINGSLRPAWLICVEQKRLEEIKLNNETITKRLCYIWEVYIDPYTGDILKVFLRPSGYEC